MLRLSLISCALATGLFLGLTPTAALAEHDDDPLVIEVYGKGFQESEPDGHAPVGVMGDHVHKEREWMLAYRYKQMFMGGLAKGTEHVSTGTVLANYMMAPLRMTGEMHMFGGMFGVTDDFTVMPMIPVIRKEMRMINRMGRQFSTKSEGIGDFRLSGLYRIIDVSHHNLLINFGVSFPTGSIDESDVTPTDPLGDNNLPYAMQLGSGTYDLLPGLTYRGYEGAWSWGAQLTGTLRLGENSNDYRLGDRLLASAWGGRKLTDWVSASTRLAFESWGNIEGADPTFTTPYTMPTADPDQQGGQRADVIFGLNFIVPDGLFAGHRLALEGGLPVYQDLDGPQMEVDHFFTISWQKTF